MGLTVWARQEKIIHGSNNLFCGTEGHPPPRPGKRNSTMLFINMHSQQNLQEYFFCKHIFQMHKLEKNKFLFFASNLSFVILGPL